MKTMPDNQHAQSMILRDIFDNKYDHGTILPTVSKLAKAYKTDISSVNAGIDKLAKDGLIINKFGRRRVVNLSEKPHAGPLDIVAFVAPAQRRFFSTFIDLFQKIADRFHTMVVFVQQSDGEPIEQTLLNLLEKNINNAVVWLDYETIDDKKVKRLRQMGMNMVFFDIIIRSAYADCVCLDNSEAIKALYKHLKEKGKKRIIYVGRDNPELSSYFEREQAYLETSSSGRVYRLPWDFRSYLASPQTRFTIDTFKPEVRPDAVICSDGELGIELKREFLSNNIRDVDLVCIDDFEECAELGITVYSQPYARFAERIFYCLLDQTDNSKGWQAKLHRLTGDLIIRQG